MSDGGPIDFADYPDVDTRSCRLLGPTALAVQGLMGVLAILSLVYKRQREKPKRPWRIWLFDVSKQVAGQMFVHGINLLISDVGAHHKGGDACVFYFLNILIDTTLGVGILYTIHRTLSHLMTETFLLKGFESGMYGTPPRVSYWLRQAAIYVMSLTSMKLLVVALLAFVPALFKLGEWLLSWTRIGGSDAVQIIFTMGVFPIIMNILQFWLIDSIVKASAASLELATESARNSADDDDREPLFAAAPDDEADDRGSLARHDIENPRPPEPSIDKGANGLAPSIREENKSSASGTSSDQGARPVVEAHAYPPSVSSSPVSAQSPLPKRTSKPVHKYKLSAPHPISIEPVMHAGIQSIQSPPLVRQAQPARVAELQEDDFGDDSSQEWGSSWEDAENWVAQVSDEGPVAPRIQEKQEGDLETWTNRAIFVGS